MRHLLQTSLELRDRYAQGEISEHGVRSATGRVEAKLDRMLDIHYRNPANRRLARHLAHERLWLFTFLYCFGLDATNNAAERAIRGMVIARKVWGGNRTWKGARTHEILASVLRTSWQQGKDAFTRCGGPGHCARRGLSRAILQLHARITDLLRTHVPRRRTGVDAPDQAGVFRPRSNRDRADRLRVVGVDTVQRRAEEPRVSATAGVTPGRRFPAASRAARTGREGSAAGECIQTMLGTRGHRMRRQRGAHLRYWVRNRERELACLLWTSPAWKMQARDAWIGWTDQQRRQNLQSLINNGRFLILPWVQVKGLASKTLALSARQMPCDWETSYGCRPLLFKILVGAARFRGTCIGLPTGSMSCKPLDAVVWTESTKLTVRRSRTSMFIRWYATCVSGYAEISRGKQIHVIKLFVRERLFRFDASVDNQTAIFGRPILTTTKNDR